jgi:putative acetyltransferase
LEDAQLNIPGTAYFDESIKKMSEFYLNKPGRNYFVITDQNDNALGGCGFAEFGTYDNSLLQKGNHIKVCELQKLYISKQARGKGLSYKLVSLIEQEAKNAGYHKIYLETHHNLPVAKQLYQKLNYTLLPNALPGSEHSTMDYFFIKDL